MTDILKVDHLNVYYRDANTHFGRKANLKHVVRNVSFTVEEGQIVGLLGESGCGKSTIAKAIMGMLPHVEGDIVLQEKHPQMVFQDPFSSLNPVKTVEFLLREPLRNLSAISREEQLERARQMLERVGLDDRYLSRYPRELSGGQRQRVALAMALMLEPKFIIADEPVSALDVTIQDQVLDLLVKLQQEMGLSILFITHDLRVAYQICSKVLIMKQGELREQGDPEVIYRKPQDVYTRELLRAADIDIF